MATGRMSCFQSCHHEAQEDPHLDRTIVQPLSNALQLQNYREKTTK
jgi:hypothetical protein